MLALKPSVPGRLNTVSLLLAKHKTDDTSALWVLRASKNTGSYEQKRIKSNVRCDRGTFQQCWLSFSNNLEDSFFLFLHKCTVFNCFLADCKASEVKEFTTEYLEKALEPSGWQAVWRTNVFEVLVEVNGMCLFRHLSAIYIAYVCNRQVVYLWSYKLVEGGKVFISDCQWWLEQ